MEQRIGSSEFGNEQCLLPDGDRDFCTSIEVHIALQCVADSRHFSSMERILGENDGSCVVWHSVANVCIQKRAVQNRFTWSPPPHEEPCYPPRLGCSFENYLAQFCVDTLAQEVLGLSIGNRVKAKLQTDVVDPASSKQWRVECEFRLSTPDNSESNNLHLSDKYS